MEALTLAFSRAERSEGGWNALLGLGLSGRGNAKIFADFSGQVVVDLIVARNGAATIEARVVPPGVAAALSEQRAAMLRQMTQQIAALHTAMESSS